MNRDELLDLLDLLEEIIQNSDYWGNVEQQLLNLVSKLREEKANMEILKTSAKSSPNSVAGAIAGIMRETGAVEIQAIGAGALNQAVKAIAIARGFLAPGGIDLVCRPAFVELEIEGTERTAIRLLLEDR